MRGPLAGKRVLVTAGGTREPLDAVRYIGNRSSGRMGVALAAEARRRGAEVTLIASNLAVAAPEDVEVVDAPTAADVEREATARRDADVVIMAAAVSDYRPAETEATKRPKDESTWQIELEPTTDVLKRLGEHRSEGGAAGKARVPFMRQRKRSRGPVLIGFAAETGEGGLERARQKLATKQVDLIVYNDVSREDVGFDADDNEVVIVSGGGERRVDKAPKDEIAAAILDEVERLS
jgi:phosphopantothenoylcysteine decarboxylase / phosphopantothenate---cysteine ligase